MRSIILCFFAAALVSTGLNAEPVRFADPRLEEVVRGTLTRLGRPPQGAIDSAEAARLIKLDAPRLGIERLEGIEHCTGLIHLDLGYNKIADLTPLAGLTKLQWLYLGVGDFESTVTQALTPDARDYVRNNLITDITPLRGLKELIFLDLAGNNDLSDLSVAAELPKLRWLILGKNNITDYSFLGRMPQLDNFANFYGNMDDADIAPLQHNKDMLRVGIAFNNITSLEFMRGYHRVYALLAQSNAITDVSPLEHLPKLDFIYLQNNRITDFSPLVRNPAIGGLDGVNLAFNPISIATACRDIEPLRERLRPRGVFVSDAVCGEVRILQVALQGQGATLPGPGSVEVLAGTFTRLHAFPLAGSGEVFHRWAGDIDKFPTRPATLLNMDVDRSVMAIFGPVPASTSGHTLTIEAVGDGAGETWPGIGGPFLYLHGEWAALLAKPAEGQYFGGWGGDFRSTDMSATIPMDSDKRITVHYSLRGHTLALAPAPGGDTVPGPGEYQFAEGTQLQVRALPGPGHAFSHWEGGIDPAYAKSTAVRVVLDKEAALTPVFMPRPARP